MYLPVLQDSRLYMFLLRVDQDLASQVAELPCRYCGGRLDSACFPRKPRGIPDDVDVGPEYRVRHSFCCRVDGCRRRHTPPSVRFLGRHVYLGVMVVLLTAMRQGPTPRGARQLRAVFGASRRTLARWQQWWREVFPKTQFWQRVKGRFMPPIGVDLPGTLVERFEAEALMEKIVGLLKFLAGLYCPQAMEALGF